MERTSPWLGRCRTAGCKFAARVDLPRGSVTRRNRFGSYVCDVDGVVREHCFQPVRDNAGGWSPAFSWWVEEVAPRCPEHPSRPLLWAPVKGVHNPDKRCTAACTAARRSDCECSCAGANHGLAHAAIR